MSDSKSLSREFTDHRFYRYRGCAPSPLDPTVSLGDPGVPVTSWEAPDVDGGEPQRQRLAREAAAKRVCARCPVLAQCRAYALSETPDGHLAEPIDVRGGLLALERHRILIRRRHQQGLTEATPAGLAEARTEQKQAVLVALCRELVEELVAAEAGMDVRTANWHRSSLCGLLGLDRETATREDLLHTAHRLGLLPAGTVIRPDGFWSIAAAPDTTGVRQRRIGPDLPTPAPAAARRPKRRGRRPAGRPRPRLRLVRPRAVQLPLFTLPLPTTPAPTADVALEPAA